MRSRPIYETSRNTDQMISLCSYSVCIPFSVFSSHWHFSYPDAAAFNQWFSTQPMRYATTLQQASCISPWGQRIWARVSLFLSVIISRTPIYIHKYLYTKGKLPSALSDLTSSQWSLTAAKHNLVLLKTQREFWISKIQESLPRFWEVKYLQLLGTPGNCRCTISLSFYTSGHSLNADIVKWMTHCHTLSDFWCFSGF